MSGAGEAGRMLSRPGAIGGGAVAGLAAAALWLLAFPWFLADGSPGGAIGSVAWFAGFLAPVPIAAVAWTTPRRWLSALGVGLGTLPLWAVHHTWVREVSFAGVFPFVAYLAVWPAVTVVAVSLAKQAAGRLGAAAVVPTVWVGVEFLRGEILFGGYAWFLAGQPMIEFLPLARSASVGGVYLVSWLVVAVAGVAVGARYGGGPRGSGWAVSAVVLCAMMLGAFVRPGSASGRSVVVAALQTNVPQSNKVAPSQEQVRADFVDLLLLAERAAEDGPDLIVTPETVFPGLALGDAGAAAAEAALGPGVNGFREVLLETQGRLGVPMLVGSLTRVGLRLEDDGAGRERLASDATHNSVFVLLDGGAVGPRYDKLRPTPFGETLPYIDRLPWLKDAVLRIGLGASGFDFGLDRGAGPVTFSIPVSGGPVRVAAPICFESSMAPVVRRLVASAEDVELLVVMTNDGWFGGFDAGRAMHLLMARWRCVEHALPMVRCANTGLSAAIDRDGRVTAVLPARTAAILAADVVIGGGGTVYAALGDWAGWASLASAGALAAAGAVRGRGRGVAGRADGDAETSGDADG